MRIKQCFALAIEREIAKIMNVKSEDVKVRRETVGITTSKVLAIGARVKDQHILAYMTFGINNGVSKAKLHAIEFYSDTKY